MAKKWTEKKNYQDSGTTSEKQVDAYSEWNPNIKDLNNLLVKFGWNLSQLDGTNDFQFPLAIMQALTTGTIWQEAGTSVTNAYVLQPSASFMNGITPFRFDVPVQIQFFVSNTNTGASTLRLEGSTLTAKPIFSESLGTLVANSLVAGRRVNAVYNPTIDAWISDVKTTAGGFTIGDAKWSDQLADHNGWLLRDGRNVSRITYSQLFALLGTRYGAGDGSTTFNIGDTRGRSPLGAGQGSGLTNRPIGEVNGEENHTLSITEMPSHGHDITYGNDAGTFLQWNGSVGSFPKTGTRTDTAMQATANGGNAPHNNMHPYIALSPFIYSGV